MIIPTKITLTDGTEVHVAEHPELKSAFDKVIKATAKSEKDKIYPQLQEYRNQIQPMMSLMTQLKPELEKVAKAAYTPATPANVQHQEETQQITSENLTDRGQPQPTTIKEARAVAQAGNEGSEAQAAAMLNDPAALMEVMGNIFKEHLDPIHQKIQTMEKDKVDNYRSQLLKTHEGAIIPEFVRGTTIQELDKSLIEAKEMYSKYATTLPNPSNGNSKVTTPETTQVNTAPVVNEAPNTEVVPPSTTLPSTQTPSSSGTTMNFKNMSQEEFKNNREAGLRKLQEKYG